MRDVYAQRRIRLVDGLRKLGFAIPRLPQGAFYVLADASGLGPLGRDSRRFAFQLLEKAHVGVTPGIDFGTEAEGHLRFCYAVSEQTIDRALASIGRALPELCAAPQDAVEDAQTRAGS
jgi:aspartate/methionine/tyrosine aminotransferase